MGFGAELINVTDPGAGFTALDPDQPDHVTAFANTQHLRDMISALAGAGGGYILIPPRRFYLGAIDPDVHSEVDADLRVDPRVALIFMPGGQLVPLSYGPRDRGYRRTRWMSMGDRYKVRIEVQGFIDAGVQQIFDVFINPDRTDFDGGSEVAGTVFFTRPLVGQVYPEWFGAKPAPPDLDMLTANDVRRTTRALQAALDAAHGQMALPDFRRNTVDGKATHYILRDGDSGFVAGPLNTHVIRAEVRDDGIPRVYDVESGYPVMETNNDHEFLSFQFGASSTRPAIPVVLNNDYVIDRELWVGVPRREVAQPRTTSEVIAAAYMPRNGSGFVLRGNRGASNSSSGNARIIASSRSEDPEGFGSAPGGSASKTPDGRPGVVGIFSTRPLYSDLSMLSIRGTAGFTVENVTFDANGVAPRCVTVADTGGSLQHGGFEGCGFLRARSELVHCGAELRLPDGAMEGVPFRTYFQTGNRLWEPQHDLSHLRFARCRFETVVHDAPNGRHSATGVFFDAGQSLGVEFRACAFEGPGNPMVHLMAGRLSFNECHFKTTPIEGAFHRSRLDATQTTTNGVDIFLDSPSRQQVQAGRPDVAGPAVPCLYARDVVSESLQFLTTATWDAFNPTTDTATVLQNVRHFPPATVQPSVYWDGPGRVNGMLEVMGCEFPTWAGGNPIRVGNNAVGLKYDLGNRVRGGGDLFQFNSGVMMTTVTTVHVMPRMPR